MTRVFEDREDAGRALAKALCSVSRRRGLHRALHCRAAASRWRSRLRRRSGLPLDVLVVRKLGLPSQPELAMGAIASGGAIVLNEDVLRFAAGRSEDLEQVRRHEQAELERRERKYRGDRPPLAMAGRVGILVDDGLATGATMEAAVPVAAGARREARGRRSPGCVNGGP